MKTACLFLFCFTIATTSLLAQELHVDPRIRLTEDSIRNTQLIHTINRFLVAAQHSNESNQFILEENKLSTYVLVDELKDIMVNRPLNDTAFYKPYLTNVISLDPERYLIRFAYIGFDNGYAQLRAEFELIAVDTAGTFLFTSPLYYYTSNWKKITSKNTTFCYEDSINLSNVKSYTDFVDTFDKKLNASITTKTYYCFSNNIGLQMACGVRYKADYNGRKEGVWYGKSETSELVLLGNNNAHFDHFDPHDVWHSQLSNVVSRRKVNKAVDEGCAYLYGGSWGYNWETIYKAFKAEVVDRGPTDWIAIKQKPVYFKTGRYRNSADYIVNALLVKKIEAEKGFAGVWELLNTAPADKDNASYYATLEKLTGINRDNYNEAIDALIAAEQ